MDDDIIEKELQFYGFIDFFKNKDSIKARYEELTTNERRIYKMYVYSTCFETEFANLSAKKFHKLKNVIYERKSILLEELSYLLHDTGWKHGINYNTGKNASYIVYIYLPNGTQLSWHCNEYQMIYYYPEIQCEWDGQVCMTMEKILNYICTRFNIGTLDFERNAA